MNSSKARGRGFSLMELMISVAIVAIIAAVAYPSYMDNVRATRRSDATAALLDTAQRLERCYSANLAYNHANCNGVFATASPEGYYTISVVRGAATFTATATATGLQVDDDDCATFTLNQAGVRTAETDGGSDNTDECWD